MRTFKDSYTVYVSNNCDNEYNGYAPFAVPDAEKTHGDGPLKSIQDALDIAAEMRENGNKCPIYIRVLGGEYAIKKPISVTPLMSGVTVEPFNEEDVIICGGKKISGFSETFFNGVRCFAAFIPQVAEGKWNFTDLYVDGLRSDMTRYPENGVLQKISAEDPSEDLFAHSKWFIAKKEDIKDFRNFEDCIVSFCHYWVDEHTPIESYDPETGKLVMKYRSCMNLNHNFEYYLENVAETFGKPNQWYLDRPSGMLYYIPRDDSQTPENIEARAPVASKFIEFRGFSEETPVKNVTFRNIKFACTRGDYVSGNQNSHNEIFASDNQAVSGADGVITFLNTQHCSIENCSLKNFGLHGFVINSGCSNIRITGCDIYDGGAGGVKINGSAHNNTISDNRILHCGRRYLSACGVLMMNSHSNTVTHNEIGDLYYTGISSGWMWGYNPSSTHDNLITHNHIHDLGQGRLSDMGGVYLLGSQPGTIVSNNLIHDIESKEYGGWALYTDEGSSSITLENNICYNTSDNSFHQHYGTSNHVRNNIFAFSKHSLLMLSRFERHISTVFENNILFSSGSEIYGFSSKFIYNETVISNRNIIFDSTKDQPEFRDSDRFRTLSKIQALGLETDSLVADPKFIDLEHFDFRLADDSPAFALGFRKIDMSDVGPRR